MSASATLFATAAGFIHVGEEDFGITMVEALAAGTPVLAVDRGGARDIVRANRDGVLIAEAADHEPDTRGRSGAREPRLGRGRATARGRAASPRSGFASG